VEQVRRWLADASRIAALTGAGVSAESGIPTFRGDGGLWRRFRAEELATQQAFERDPCLVWEWYDWRRQRIAQAEPNPAHRALAKYAERMPGFALITQNVDGLHERAGSRGILRLHGDIWLLRCVECGREQQDNRAPLPELPPRCACGGLMRPGVVWFGEGLPRKVWEHAEEAARGAQVFLVVGTSAAVYPAAGLIALAKSCGAMVVEVNPEPSAAAHLVDAALRGPAGTILPDLLRTAHGACSH
jgi:NAD-dependent deacetylase